MEMVWNCFQESCRISVCLCLHQGVKGSDVRLSVCVVSFNTADLTYQCVRSVLDHTVGLEYEIIVVDNASTDGSFELLSREFGDRITLVRNPTNRYFTGGFNDALFRAKGKYALVLNSDTRLSDNSLKIMSDFLDLHSDVGGIEGTIIDDESGKLTPTSSRELTPLRERVRSIRLLRRLLKPVYDEYRYAEWDRATDREVEVICDAFMMVRTDLVQKIGGYPEALKMYFTEEYLSDRIRGEG
ncbi:MAG: glycosyltransferase, partial [Deltaproteobacteria bacterium]|nr:glycosyltransferase [Deltaproteobacteria bacterium]